MGTIIIVDDNKGMLTAVQLLLKNHFSKVITLSSPVSLSTVLREENPEVVLLDMNFTSGINNGNEGLFWLHEIKRQYRDLPVVLLGITVREEQLRILAFNDINSELDEKEIDSWIRLTRVLTHEIMNSVTPITSLSETLLSLADTRDEEIRRGLQTISTTGKGLLSFVESYRRFTRIPTPEPSLFYVKAFIDRMVELARHQNKCDNITFHIDIAPADLIVYADENLISQVVINLLKNAIQAIDTQADGKIEIQGRCNAAEEILIEIKNNGPAIPSDIADHIFIPFFTTKEGGSGIGLSISRQIMRLSGGSITLLQGKETKFILKFK